MDFRWSASTLKKWKNCPFSIYCKITEQEEDANVDTSYGDAGSVVHHTLEYYFKELKSKELETALSILKKRFYDEWETYDIVNRYIDKDVYWECVINGIKLNITPTDLEYKFVYTKDGLDYVGYADVMNTKEHWIGDWKTSKYKKAKLNLYRTQLKCYAWAYWKEFNIIPKTWVYFNKVDKLFTFEFTLEELQNLELEFVEEKKNVEKAFETLDFKRCPSSSNCYFCPYKQICATDLLREEKAEDYEVVFHLKKNKVLIEATMSDVIHRKIEKITNFKLKNAHFIIATMKARGIRVDGIKRLYKRKDYGGETFIGFANSIYTILKNYAHSKGKKIKLSIKDYRDQSVLKNTIKVPDKLNTKYEPYPYQLEVPEILIKNRWAIAEIGTGGGKTYIAAEIIRKLGLKTLFIIDNKDLLLQTKDSYEKMLGIKCGIVGMGYREWDAPVVLATIQTLYKSVDVFAKELAKIPVVIYDEVQIIASKSFETLSKYLCNTKYRFGLSATAKRDDDKTNILFAHAGTIVYSRKAKVLIDDDILINPSAVFYKYEQPKLIAADWQSEYAAGIVENESRNNIILNIARKYQEEGKQIMILTKMIDHGKWFVEQLEGSKLVYGKTPDKIRLQTVKDFRECKFPILVGNIKIFNKGLDFKAVEVLINASGNAGEVASVQSIGRALRNNLDKTNAYYIDFIDKGEYLYKHSMGRIEALKKEGYTVDIESYKA